MSQLEIDLNKLLAARNTNHLMRNRKIYSARQGQFVIQEQQKKLCFINNDYFGLATHPHVIKALHSAVEKYGIGSSASPLLGGYYQIHQQLEDALAHYLKQERAILFSSCFLANFAIQNTLFNKSHVIFHDRLNHASLIDGGLACHAKLFRYRHLDTVSLEKKLLPYQHQQCWVISDGVFSMDGDLAPLPKLLELQKKYNFNIVLDESHALGVLGKGGRGSFEHHHTDPQKISLITASFGKSLGTMGAVVAGNNVLIEALIQWAKPYIYSTALSPAVSAATLASLKIMQAEPWRRLYLQSLISYFNEQAKALSLPFLKSITPIQILAINNIEKTMALAKKLEQKNILVGAIRPPTVPPNSARLRINLTTYHNKDDIDFILKVIRDFY